MMTMTEMSNKGDEFFVGYGVLPAVYSNVYDAAGVCLDFRFLLFPIKDIRLPVRSIDIGPALAAHVVHR